MFSQKNKSPVFLTNHLLSKNCNNQTKLIIGNQIHDNLETRFRFSLKHMVNSIIIIFYTLRQCNM